MYNPEKLAVVFHTNITCAIAFCASTIHISIKSVDSVIWCKCSVSVTKSGALSRVTSVMGLNPQGVHIFNVILSEDTNCRLNL